MSAVPYDVAEQFMRGRTARAGAFVSVGDALYSYGLKIAHWTEDGLVWDIDPDAKAPSVTTARHIRAARGVLPTPNECRAMRDDAHSRKLDHYMHEQDRQLATFEQ